ncbi:abscisic acid 8'-hydroxylase 2 isoform X2 [Magnolia sinica]|uniref:abscisic acid 8'-hydroxylase 2 isoform X2 n=1 Tax=Magnolia sinica TaxID=86752 RepID=UPI00265988E9|nr:abscisic acid 8'-hydroxylase 2 isoform X2 [Magnolia sinica]
MVVFTLLHLISLLLISLSLFQIAKICFHRHKSTVGIPPGSCGFPLMGETLEFLAANNSSRGFYDFVRIRRQRYGNCFKTSIFGKTHVFVSSTEAAKAVLGSDFIDFTKRYIRSIAELVGNQSLLCASQEHHKLIRSGLSNLFTTDSTSLFIKQFDVMVIEALNDWKGKESVLVLNDTMKITFVAICKMLMSLENLGELEMLKRDVGEVCDAMLAFPLKLPWTRFYKGLKARKRVMERLKKIIAIRRQGLEYHEDFLQSLLMDGGSSCDVPLSDVQIQDNILTLIIAGQVTTASAMTWMVKYLDENQGVQETLRELQFLLANTAGGPSLRLEDLNEMPYASKVVKESLRMASVVSWFPRVALKDCWIEGGLKTVQFPSVRNRGKDMSRHEPG